MKTTIYFDHSKLWVLILFSPASIESIEAVDKASEPHSNVSVRRTSNIIPCLLLALQGTHNVVAVFDRAPHRRAIPPCSLSFK